VDAGRLLAAALTAAALLVLVLPELNKSFVKAEEDVVTRVLEHFTQPELFALDEQDLSGDWLYTVRGYDEGLLEGLYLPQASVEDWGRMRVPSMAVATRGNSTLWLRRDFELEEELKGQRIRLVFLGAFYKAHVWLNGVYLGSHEGYFAPFYFDVADKLLYDGVNVLVVCLSTPVEFDLDNKVGVAGVFNDWDMKPYPRWALGRLPPRYEWVVPIGLWRPVKLVGSGPVAVTAVLVDPSYNPSTGSASLRIRFYVTNAGGDAQVSLDYAVKPYNFEGPESRGSVQFAISSGERRWVEATLPIQDARPWWTWDQGEPSLYTISYEARVGGDAQGRASLVTGIRSVDGRIAPNEAYVRINGRRVFLRGLNYISNFTLGSPADGLRRDLKMVREANANYLRVHAHVEPAEFYSMADEEGVALQVDGPLIWAYAANRGYQEYRSFMETAQGIFAEMVYLLYNHPSVIMWTVHNEPPWASQWMGDLYRRAVNRDLDQLLASLISTLDAQGRPVIMGSGYEDQHVYSGWFGGSWADFLNDYSRFPTEFGAEALPSPDSPFWRLVNVTHWPISEGDDLYYEFAYRGFYWASGYVSIPYGLPRDYESLEAYIDASQEYQALLVKTAVDRYRILKFNYTGGLAAFMFGDCFPGITFSLVDYYRVPKMAYRVLSSEYKPLKLIIEWGGDYRVDGTRVYYDPNVTLRFRLWLVNDDPRLGGPVKARWRLIDLDSGAVLGEGGEEAAVPGCEEPARLIKEVAMATPAFLDGAHRLALEAELASANGSTLDSDSFLFTVRPSSQVVLTLEESRAPLTFLVQTDRLSFYVNSSGDKLVFTVPSGSRVTVAGPVWKGGNASVFLPVLLDLGRLPAGSHSSVVKLVKGALYVLRTPMPSSEESRPPQVSFRINPLEGIGGPYILEYSPGNAMLYLALGLRGNTFVVPAETPVNVSYTIVGEKTSIAVERGPLTLGAGEVYVDMEPASRVASVMLEETGRLLSIARERLSWASRRGLYLGLTQSLVDGADAMVREAREVAGRDPEKAVVVLREAHDMLLNAIGNVSSLYTAARANFPLLMLLVLLASFGLSSLLVEDESKRPLIGTAALFTLGILLYLSYPGIQEVGTIEMITGLYVSFFVFIVILIVPRLLEDLRSERGLPVFAAVSAALSIASRNLRRRSLRTGLALASIICMALAVTNLSSISYYVMSRELVTTSVAPAQVDNCVMVFKNGVFQPEEVASLSSQPEVVDYGFKIDSIPRREPYARLGPMTIRAFLGFYGYSPHWGQLAAIVEPGGALAILRTRDDAAIVSRSWAAMGVRVGDSLLADGVRLVVVGYFDPVALSGMQDIGSHELRPEAMRPDGSVAPASPEELMIVSPGAALRLRGVISRLYARTSTAGDALELGRRLSLQLGYTAVARPAGENLRVFYVGSAVEFRGSEAFMPMLLVFLNVGMIVLASAYERRREIFTLASVGLNPTHIFLVFLSEALLLGFVGGSLGYICGFVAFRLLQAANAYVPVDLKAETWNAVLIVGLSVLAAVVAAVVPALRASAYATPSLRRKWRLEAERVGEEWVVDIPARIPADKAASFVDFVAERFREEEVGIERVITDISVERRVTPDGITYEVSFSYGRGGNRPFKAPSRLVVKPVAPGFYGSVLYTRPISVYMRFLESYVQDVASFVRTVVLEWASLRVRLMLPVGSATDYAVSLIRHYNPQLVILLSRRADTGLVREIRRRVYSLGLRPPAMEVIQLKGPSLAEAVEEVRGLLAKADIIGLDSDDGFLSAAIALAAALEGRRVASIRDGRVEEVSIEKFIARE